MSSCNGKKRNKDKLFYMLIYSQKNRYNIQLYYSFETKKINIFGLILKVVL
jgi:hypothetical protein